MQSIEVELKQAIQNAVKKAFDLDLDVQNIVVETPKNKDHGDFSSNVAMQLTRQLHQKPIMIAQSILDAFSLEMVLQVLCNLRLLDLPWALPSVSPISVLIGKRISWKPWTVVPRRGLPFMLCIWQEILSTQEISQSQVDF